MGHSLSGEASVVPYLAWKYKRAVCFSPSFGPLLFPGFLERVESRGRGKKRGALCSPLGKVSSVTVILQRLPCRGSPNPSNCEPGGVWPGLPTQVKATGILRFTRGRD